MARTPVYKSVRDLVAQARAVVVAVTAKASDDEVKVAFGAERLTSLGTVSEALEGLADAVDNLERAYDAKIAERREAEEVVTAALRTVRGLVQAFHPDNDRAAAGYGFDVITTSPAPAPAVVDPAA